MAKLKNGFKPNDLAKDVVKLLFPYRLNIKTITTDNGLEFRAHEYITKRLGIPIYFADPYASWQKGAIEYTNKLIRQYIPKSSDFSEVTTQETRTIIQKLNNRPREKINFKKPIDCFLMHYR